MNRVYYGYWIVAAGLITQFIAVGMSNYVAGAFMVPMNDEFGWTRAEFSASRSLGQLMVAFTGFMIGSWIDRWGGRPFIAVGSLVMSAALYSLSLIQNLPQWLLLNGIVLTIGGALIGNLVINVTLGKWFVERRGWAVALAAMGISGAGIVLPPIAAELVDTYGWRESWRILSLITLLSTLPMSLIVRRRPEDFGLHPDGKTQLQVDQGHGAAAQADFARSMTRAQAMRTSEFYFLVVAFGLFQISITVMLLQTIPLMTDAGYSRTVASLMISLASVPAFLSKPFWGVLIDRFQPRLLAAVGAAITGLSVIFIVYTIAGRMDFLVYTGFLIMGVGWGGMLPLQEVIWASFFGRRYLGSVRSMALPFSFGLSAVGPVLVAWYYDIAGNYDLALIAMGLCNLTSAFLLLRLHDGTISEPDAKLPSATAD